MRRLCAGFLLTVALVGCSKESPVGGPGAPSANLRVRSDYPETRNDGFTITVPAKTVTVQRDGETPVTIGIRRESGFKQKVRIAFEGAPKGVTFNPAKGEIVPDQKELQVTVRAAKEAAAGEASVRVDGIPEKEGKITSVTMRVKVE